jgi:hypothetical protein
MIEDLALRAVQAARSGQVLQVTPQEFSFLKDVDTHQWDKALVACISGPADKALRANVDVRIIWRRNGP